MLVPIILPTKRYTKLLVAIKTKAESFVLMWPVTVAKLVVDTILSEF